MNVSTASSNSAGDQREGCLPIGAIKVAIIPAISSGSGRIPWIELSHRDSRGDGERGKLLLAFGAGQDGYRCARKNGLTKGESSRPRDALGEALRPASRRNFGVYGIISIL
jgi:hypothetical protein